MARPADAPIDEQFANLAAGDALAAHSHLRIRDNGKPGLLAELVQLSQVALGSVSKVKIETLVHFFGAKSSAQ